VVLRRVSHELVELRIGGLGEGGIDAKVFRVSFDEDEVKLLLTSV
jgi:hypothetical protein